MSVHLRFWDGLEQIRERRQGRCKSQFYNDWAHLQLGLCPLTENAWAIGDIKTDLNIAEGMDLLICQVILTSSMIWPTVRKQSLGPTKETDHGHSTPLAG